MFAAYYEGIEHESDPQLRAQRALDMLHVKRIVNYLDRSVRAFGSPIATARVVSVTGREHTLILNVFYSKMARYIS